MKFIYIYIDQIGMNNFVSGKKVKVLYSVRVKLQDSHRYLTPNI